MTTKGSVKRVILWTAPRCISSAFERSILTLPNTKLISEPFGVAYYYGPQRQSQRFDSQEVEPMAKYEDVAKVVMDQPADDIDVVFAKDMAYYMEGKMSVLEESLKDVKHSFLIRDPKKAIPSFLRLMEKPEIRELGWDYFDPKEAGFQQLYEIYEFVKEKLDPHPVVIDADDLLGSPEEIMKAYCERVGMQYADHMTTWEAGEVPEAWNDIWGLTCRDNAIKSSGFVKRAKPSGSDVPDVQYPADVMKTIKDSQPFYEKLYAARIKLE